MIDTIFWYIFKRLSIALFDIRYVYSKHYQSFSCAYTRREIKCICFAAPLLILEEMNMAPQIWFCKLVKIYKVCSESYFITAIKCYIGQSVNLVLKAKSINIIEHLMSRALYCRIEDVFDASE